MKNKFLPKVLRLALLSLTMILVTLLLTKVNNDQKIACALEDQSDQIAMSSSVPPKPSTEMSVTTENADPDGANAAITTDSQDQTKVDSDQTPVSSTEPGPTASISQDLPLETSSAQDSIDQSDPPLSSGLPSPQDATSDQPETQEETPQYKEDELLVKFKEGVSSEQIDAINASHHTTILELIEQIGVYHLGITDGRSAQEVINSYQEMQEVEYAELNAIYSIPETGNNVETIDGN